MWQKLKKIVLCGLDERDNLEHLLKYNLICSIAY